MTTATTTVMPEPRQRYYNNDGTVAAGCYLYTYAAGTTTPKATYSDSAATTQHANPIVLDSKGEAVVYWAGSYKVDLKTPAGVQITGYPVDNFNAQPDSGYRDVATQDVIYYVRTDGSDSNTGLANTAGAAFLTIQKAIDTIYNDVDTGGYDAYVYVADGTYTGGITMDGKNVGGGTIYIIGNTSVPASCVISTTSSNCVALTGGASAIIKGFKFQTTTSGAALLCYTGSTLLWQQVNFGACVGSHIECGHSSYMAATGSYSISGGAASHLHCGAPGFVSVPSTITVTITNTPAFSSYFIGTAQGTVVWDGPTVTGSATGKRYLAHYGGIIRFPQSFAYTSIPGDSAGTASAGGIAVGSNTEPMTICPDIYSANTLELQATTFNTQSSTTRFKLSNALSDNYGYFYCNGDNSYSSGITHLGVATAVDVTTGTTDGITVQKAGTGYQIFNASNNGLGVARLRRRTSDGVLIETYRDTTNVGSISVTTTATAYNTSSDYRLKTVEGSLSGSGDFIDSLSPKFGTWNIDGSKFVGFIAHELQAVSPTSVTGEKDSVDEGGNPVYQSVSYGSPEIIANIIAELQGLRARVKSIENKGN